MIVNPVMNPMLRFAMGVMSLVLCSQVTAQSQQYGALSYTITQLEAHIQGCDRSASGNVVIPSEIDGYPVTTISKDAFQRCSLITGIQIPSSIKTIGQRAFQNCESLLSFTIPPGAKLGVELFVGCTKLSVVDWPEDIEIVPEGCFMNCEQLKSINLPVGVTTISNFAFVRSGLETVALPRTVHTIGFQAFAFCRDLRSAGAPEGTTTIKEQAFYGCDFLTQALIPERFHSESEAIRIGLELAWPNGFLFPETDLTGPEESLEIRLAPVVTVKGVPGEVKTIDVADSPDGPWKLWRIVIVATGGASEVDLDEGAEHRFYRIRP